MSEELVFDWDEANTKHIARHDVTSEEVEQVFADGEIDTDYDVIGGERNGGPS